MSGAYGGLVETEPFAQSSRRLSHAARRSQRAPAQFPFSGLTVGDALLRGLVDFFTPEVAADGSQPLETVAADNAMHQASAGYFKMTLDAGVGTFSGDIQLGAGIGRVRFCGVLLPKTGVGRGQVRFADEIGEVELGAP